MKKFAVACILSLPLLVTAQTAKPAAPAPQAAVSHAPAVATMLPAEQTALVKQYCATCQTGGKPLADRRMSRLLK